MSDADDPARRARPRVSRRTLFAGVGVTTGLATAGVVGIDQGFVPGRSSILRRLRLDGEDGVLPDVTAGPTTSGTFISEARAGKETGWTIARPPGGAAAQTDLPVAVVLHAWQDDHTAAFDTAGMGLGLFLADAVSQGVAPFALASVDGGLSYWHAREDGEDSASMVIDEFIPFLASQGLDTTKVGLFGWSMGGFGALHLGRLLGPDRVAAVGAMSPGIWTDYDQTDDFDSEADYDEVMVFGRQGDLDGIPVRIDCGQGDPFYAATREYVESFRRRPAGGFERGDHDIGYWRRMAPHHLRFLGNALSGP